jgi:hypothetical protein
MKKNLLKAVLLVITMMVGGTNSAWADGETVQVTISSEAEVATYCNCDGKALDFSSVEGLTAYIVSSIDGGIINLQAVKKIPAGTGVVVAGEPKTYKVPVIASADPVVGNLLIGVTSYYEAKEGDYVLAYLGETRGFYPAEPDTEIPVGKAYLHIGGSDARSFLPLNNETTGIGALLMNNEKVKKEIFSLSGQRVSQPKKGLYIIGGRKVVVK